MKILIVGANGQVGYEIIKLFSTTKYEIIGLTRKEFDCTQFDKFGALLDSILPNIIINAVAYTAVDKAEVEINLAYIINAEFVSYLAKYCAENSIPLIHLSTDYIFDGRKEDAYCETDIPHPLGVYAQSKLAGEQAIISQLEEHIILRLSWVFGINGTNFVKTILNLASTREELRIVADQWGKPTAASDIARVLLQIVNHINQPSFSNWGIYHYAGDGVTNWYEFAKFFINQAKEKGARMTLKSLNPIKSEEYVTQAIRPKNSVLNTQKIEQIFAIQPHPWKHYLPEILTYFIEKQSLLSGFF